MTKVAILIPCHIYYNEQIHLLDKCIDSLINQSVKCDIYISISFENDIYKDNLKNILEKYNKEVKFRLSKKQLFQMEHLYKLFKENETEYEAFMFCDDDDTYHFQRVEILLSYFEFSKKQNIENLGGVREISKSDDDEGIAPEYWAYFLRTEVLKVFFSRFNNQFHLLKHKFGDMFLRYFLRKNLTYHLFAHCNKSLYNYYKNPNGITGSIKKNGAIIYDNILLEVIESSCRNNKFNLHNYVKILCKKMGVSYKTLNKDILIKYEYIYKFCQKVLYV